MLSCLKNGVSETPADNPTTNICVWKETQYKSSITMYRVVLKYTWLSFIYWCVFEPRLYQSNPLTLYVFISHATWTYHSSTAWNRVCFLYPCFSLYYSSTSELLCDLSASKLISKTPMGTH